jgi:diguanylate cyclase (GGDEF)-like protein
MAPGTFVTGAFLLAAGIVIGFLLVGRFEGALLTIGFAAYAIGAWDSEERPEASILLGASVMAAASALTGLGLRNRVRTCIEQAARSRTLTDRLAVVQAERDELEAARKLDFERAAGLVRINADLVGVQLELESNYRVIEELNANLERLAATDALTGLPNRRAFEEMLQAQIEISASCREPVSLLILDVDHFKLYNDAYGHVEGDELLKELADAIRDEVRETDLAARYGGEEFAVLLPMTDADRAAVIAERVRAHLEAHPFVHGGITVSIGVATLSGRESIQPRDLVVSADQALYEAKAAGRNRVVCAGGMTTRLDRRNGAGTLQVCDGGAAAKRAGRSARRQPRAFGADTLGGIEGLVQQPSGTILAALLAALDLRDHETEGHSQRVARYALRLGVELSLMCSEDPSSMRKYLLDPGDIRQLALGAMLHDIGKLHVPDAILRKKGPLDEAEWLIMKRHPAVGADLVARFPDLEPAATVVRFHHERWDGAGYPEGRSGASIPLVARIFCVCDTLDAMTSDRPYRAARSFAEAVEEIRRCRGKQFDPVVADAFLRVDIREWEMLARGERMSDQARAA